VRIALLSDVHGNGVALRAVIADIERRGVDRVVCLGDVATLGPEPVESIAALRDLGCDCVLGNHETFLLDPPSHTHIPMVRQHRGMLLLNCGSVGAPFLKPPRAGPPTLLPHAEYATVEAERGRVEVALHRVELDSRDLRKSVHASPSPLREMLVANYRW
jgi:predicted phosphodiesterase